MEVEQRFDRSIQAYRWKSYTDLTTEIQSKIHRSVPIEKDNPMRTKKMEKIWLRRTEKLLWKIKDFKPHMKMKAEKLISVFIFRKSLRLKLRDNYLKVVWGNCSRATAHRAIEYFEGEGLIKRKTSKPQFKEGSFTQERYLLLIIPDRYSKQFEIPTVTRREYQRAAWEKKGVLITDEQYKRHLEATNCDLCGVQFSEISHRMKHMDHCHETGHYRGSLCMPCNASALGRLGDNLDQVIEKIENYKKLSNSYLN